MRLLFIILIAVVAAACSSGPSQQVTNGEVLLNETFDSEDAWENYQDSTRNIFVANGVYNVTLTGVGNYIWGLNATEHTDVVIEATARQLSTTDNNGYGLMCRANPSNNGEGYYFFVSGDGFYSIQKAQGSSTPAALVNWTNSNAINQGQGVNNIRVVCLGDYLALYVNGNFLTETRDSSFTSGYAGITGAQFEAGDLNITFDNLNIYTPVLGS